MYCPNSLIDRIKSINLVFILTLFTIPLVAQVDDTYEEGEIHCNRPSITVAGHDVKFAGYDYDILNCTSYFYYCITSNPGTNAVSHYTFGNGCLQEVCEGTGELGTWEDNGGSITHTPTSEGIECGNDPNTGITGIKDDNEFEDGEIRRVYLKLTGIRPLSESVEIGIKASGNSDSDIISGPDICDINCNGRIGDYVWMDTNMNGIQDPGEEGINGVDVCLYWADTDELLGTLTTTNNPDDPTRKGFYRFENLPPGNYYLRFKYPPGFNTSPQDEGGDDTMDSDVNPNDGQTPVIDLDEGEDDPTVDGGLNDNVLDVNVRDLSLQVDGNTVTVLWSSLSEVDHDKTVVLRQKGDDSFRPIASFKGEGDNKFLKEYSFTDRHLKKGETYHYKLQHISINGKSEYSETLTARISGVHKLSVHPNPASDYVILSLPLVHNYSDVEFIDMSGRIAMTRNLNSNDDEIRIETGSLERGIYHIRFTSSSEFHVSKLVLTR